MTADDAGVNVRERLAKVLHDADCLCGFDSDIAHYLVNADAALAAGFGDVAEAKAENESLRKLLLLAIHGSGGSLTISDQMMMQVDPIRAEVHTERDIERRTTRISIDSMGAASK